jgi:hypothetical protein
MTLRKLHLVVGFAGFAAFLGTGAYMFRAFPELYAGNETLRYLYRANHIYLLLASLVNLALGLQPWVRLRSTWAAARAAGSWLVAAAPPVLFLAFVMEAPQVSPDRIVTALGIYGLLLGVVLQLVSAARGA